MWKGTFETVVALLVYLAPYAASNIAVQENNDDLPNLDLSNGTYMEIEKNGQTLYVPEVLMKKIELEKDVWHWTPWLRTRTKVEDHVIREVVTCPYKASVDQFPDSAFSDVQLRQGAFLFYLLFGIYSFTLLAIICNDYFIPCVELICEDLKIPQNVAAATFMAVATSCPEFFVNTISTFLTESDMGIGTIVGSAIFNALGVGAIGGLAAITPIAIDMRPVTRDIIIYMVNVGVLVAIVWDGQVDWYEALVLGILYVLYFIIMFNSTRLFAIYDKYAGNKLNTSQDPITEIVVSDIDRKSLGGIENKGFDQIDEFSKKDLGGKRTSLDKEKGDKESEKSRLSIFSSVLTYPRTESICTKMWWLYSLPLKIVLGATIPSTVHFRKFYPLAFVMCIVWIGVNSYVVTWSMSVIGYTLFIPESVMGMTFLAFGGCLPEACSIYIMSRRGEGGMGVSNALGANSLAILFALGLPWLIRTLTLLAEGAEDTTVLINSSGIDFVVGSLLVAVSCLWIVLYLGKFILRRKIGVALLILYIIFITFAILVETGVMLNGNAFTC